MANHKGKNHDKNQGEGDKVSARTYNERATAFVDEHRVEQAAKDAKAYVDANPAEAKAAEEVAKAGPSPIRRRIDELVTEGKAMLARVKAKFTEMMDRAK